MRFNKNEVIAGFPLLRIRDMLRSFDDDKCGYTRVAEALGIKTSAANAVIKALIDRGWLAFRKLEYSDDPYLFAVTSEGRRLALHRAVARLSRAKAQKLLESFLQRCADVDTRDDYGYYPRQVRLFGSYLTDAEDLGDIDLHVELLPRPINDRDIVNYSINRAREAGKRLDFIGRISYAQTEVVRILKARSPYLSIHDWDDPVARGAAAKVVFVSKRFPPDNVVEE